MGQLHISNPISLALTLTAFLVLTQIHVSKSDGYTSMIYKGCAQQAFSDPTGSTAQTLASLLGSLVSQSSKVKFYKNAAGAGQTNITGLFQCRGDLSGADCYQCVSKIPQLTNTLCGPVVAARVQLLGCYVLYEVAGFSQISGMEMLYKSCSSTNVRGVGFEERRDMAFQTLANGVVSGHGFYKSSFESVYVLGQCEGDVGDADCGDCVHTAIQKAQVECGGSVGGEVYLHKCFITYGYYPNGIPKNSPSSSSSSSSSSSNPSSSSSSSSSYTTSPSSSGMGPNSGKTVAIILGGAAGVGFLVIFMMFARNAIKRKNDY
ncbi:unnamed protein product [Rhodiola kirilowii]